VKVLQINNGIAIVLKMVLNDGVLSVNKPIGLWSVPLDGMRLMEGTLAPRWCGVSHVWQLHSAAREQLFLTSISEKPRTTIPTSVLNEGWEGQLVLALGKLAERRWIEKDVPSRMHVLFYDEQPSRPHQTSSSWLIGPHAHLESVPTHEVVFLFDWEVDLVRGGILVHH
jgi:hypothetical protein